jgi:DNA invertase Pin-like site-specific DNA recombinase
MNVAYIRVSTAEQNEARQVEALKVHQIERVFKEKVSGKDTNRAQLQEMLQFVREGDTVYVEDFSRLARSTKDLLQIVELLNEKKVHLVSEKEHVDSSTPQGKLMLTMIGAIAEFERENILERQREGIALAKQRGVYKGRRPVHVSEFAKQYQRYRDREIKTKTELAKKLGISRTTLNKLIKEYEQKN